MATNLFTRTGKEVLFAGVHYADAHDDTAAEMIVSALNGGLAATSEMAKVLNDAVLALAMCEPRTRHGADCQHNALVAGGALLAKVRGGR